MEDEDRYDEDDDEGDSGENHDEEEAGLVGRKLFELKVLQFTGESLQSIGKMFWLARLVVHVVFRCGSGCGATRVESRASFAHYWSVR
jgi:hypothetical protein